MHQYTEACQQYTEMYGENSRILKHSWLRIRTYSSVWKQATVCTASRMQTLFGLVGCNGCLHGSSLLLVRDISSSASEPILYFQDQLP